MPFRFQAEPVKAFRYFILFLLLVFALHLPFLDADPHVKIAFNSVDAFTDEGLYTSQLRNFINHGYLDVRESDALIKSPLFNALLAVPLWIFGTHLPVARLTVLLAGLSVLIYAFRKAVALRTVLFIFSILALMQFQVFQYMHFSMSDGLSSLCMVAGILLLGQHFFSEEEQKKKTLVSALFLFTIAWYLKNSFLHSMVLYTTAILIVPLFKKRNSEKFGSAFKTLLVFLSVSLLVYFLSWYLPFRDFYDYIMDKAAEDRIIRKHEFWKVVKENYRTFFYSEEVKYVTYLFYFSVLLTPLVWIKRKSLHFGYVIICVVLWLLLESGKLTTYWVPGRYLMTPVMAMLLYISIVLSEIFLIAKKERTIFSISARAMGLIVVLIVVGCNTYQYLEKFGERKYLIRNINNILKTSMEPGATIIGPWAPTFSWDCRARSVPVWANFLNDDSPIEKYKPAVVVADEFLEGMFEEHQVNLNSISMRKKEIDFHIVRRKPIYIYWLTSN
jgi:hypothetical protein